MAGWWSVGLSKTQIAEMERQADVLIGRLGGEAVKRLTLAKAERLSKHNQIEASRASRLAGCMGDRTSASKIPSLAQIQRAPAARAFLDDRETTTGGVVGRDKAAHESQREAVDTQRDLPAGRAQR